jgi:hypothetical protein
MAAWAICFAGAGLGDSSSRGAEPIDFVRDIRPIFEAHCYDCHSGDEASGGLRLDVKSAALKGGDRQGPDIVPGHADQSPLIERITSRDDDQRMPPDEPLSASKIETLIAWMNAGAAWPDGVDVAQLEDRTDHWSFKPLASVSGELSLDAFIVRKLAEQGLSMSPPADRRSWLRRVTFDLTGLPPTPEEVDSFLNDGREDAFERVVDRLLASERYGERWAQHWLDVVRYADTHGFEVNSERPHAWPYRDYVIRALNEDCPYDRFVREQIVGDQLGDDAATGFLVTASVLLPDQIGKDEASIRLARQDALDEIVNNIGQTFLALSIGCARCHDHKFDPIEQKDYYSMQAFVAGVEYLDRENHSPEATEARKTIEAARVRIEEIGAQLSTFAPVIGSVPQRSMVQARRNTDRFVPVRAKQVRFTIQATNQFEPCIDELEVFDTQSRNVALAEMGAIVTASGSNVSPDRHELRFVNDGLYGNSRSWMSSETGGGWVAVEFPTEVEIDRVIWGRDREGNFGDRLATSYVIEAADASGQWRKIADATDRVPFDAGAQPAADVDTQGLSSEETQQVLTLNQERTALEAHIKSADAELLVFAGRFREPDEIHRLNRGDPEQPRERVVPAVPAALGDLALNNETPESTRRRQLADWIVSPDNSLTARVIVNRIWQGHFGRGLVETPSDFGRSGTPPSHPELLDWLTAEFLYRGWSMKALHRTIVLSQTYRQSSAFQEEPAEKDADARWLWRYPSRRLEAEAIRDSMLAVSGQLNLEMYGPGYDLFDRRGGLSGFQPVETLSSANQRRMIYAHKVRREPEAVFGAFDCPDAGQSTAVRRASTTPIQALNLFNSRFTLDVAAALAERVASEVGGNLQEQIQRVYQLALSRAATTDEVNDAEPVVRTHGLAVLCRALFNSNEFLMIP